MKARSSQRANESCISVYIRSQIAFMADELGFRRFETIFTIHLVSTLCKNVHYFKARFIVTFERICSRGYWTRIEHTSDKCLADKDAEARVS